MERKILFKAKKLSDGKWIKGDLLQHSDGSAYIAALDNVHEVDPSTVCQFTGLKDKDGKEVWEHDIFSPYEGCSYSCEVIFEKSSFKALSHKGRVRMPILNGIDYFNWKLRVIGNKFDRKEGEK